MRNWLLALALVCLSVFSSVANANEYTELRVKLSAARDSLVAMLLHKDKRGADQQKLVKDSADEVSAMLAKLKAPAGKEAQFKELNETWVAFKKTRETELVPAILKGSEDEAKKIAGGIQKERYTKCQKLVGELEN